MTNRYDLARRQRPVTSRCGLIRILGAAVPIAAVGALAIYGLIRQREVEVSLGPATVKVGPPAAHATRGADAEARAMSTQGDGAPIVTGEAAQVTTTVTSFASGPAAAPITGEVVVGTERPGLSTRGAASPIVTGDGATVTSTVTQPVP